MVRTWIAVGFISLLAGLGSGCCVDRHALSDGGCRGGGCGQAIDPILGDCNKCGVCGGTECPGYTPCGYLKYMLTCGSGCSGDIYYHEWISDPPDCCDPCDNCGNWCDEGCCGRNRPLLNGIKALFGERYCDSCGYGDDNRFGGNRPGGCATCGRGTLNPIESEDVIDGLDEPEALPSQKQPPTKQASPPKGNSPHPARDPNSSTPEHKAARPTGGKPKHISAAYTRPAYEDPTLR